MKYLSHHNCQEQPKGVPPVLPLTPSWDGDLCTGLGGVQMCRSPTIPRSAAELQQRKERGKGQNVGIGRCGYGALSTVMFALAPCILGQSPKT